MSHDRWLENAAAYVLDSLDQWEVPAFEEHLQSCAECQSAVNEFREVTGMLALAAPAKPAPAGLRSRITESVRTQIAPPKRRPSYAWLPAAAMFVLAAGLSVLWLSSARARAQLDARNTALEAQLSRRDSVLAQMTGREVHVVSLAVAGEAKPRARVFWNHEKKTFVVTAFGLAAPPPGQTYQLWAISNGKPPVSMGTFTTDETGAAMNVLPVPQAVEDLGFINTCALTVEPAAGSAAPTAPVRLSGEWRHVD